MTDGHVVATPLLLPGQRVEFEDPPPNPGHPACAEYAESDYCRESWQLHVAELAQRPEPHWHKCDYGRFCAIVPVVCQGQCIAAIKLACPAAKTTADFEQRVRLLSMLTANFVFSHADFLARLVVPHSPPVPSPRPPCADLPPPPKVARALELIDQHLSDPKLNVARIARELALHPNYLSQLFSERVGVQMHRFIRSRRVELACTLLATTDWPIKRIAHETGHANPNWFCHVFRDCTGQTPGQWRRNARQVHSPGSND